MKRARNHSGTTTTTSFKSEDIMAEITESRGLVMLTMRDRRGRIWRRRYHESVESAKDEMWRYASVWRVA